MKFGIFAATLVVLLSIGDREASADEIKVYSTPTLKTVLDRLAPDFQRSSGHTLATRYGSVAALKKEIDSGAAFDVAVLVPAMVDELILQGRIVAGSRTDIARTGTGVAIRAGLPRPDVSTVDALRRALLAAKSLAYDADSASGRSMLALFDRLAIRDQVTPRLVSAAGGSVMKAIADGKAEMTVITIPNIVGVPGVELAGLLPPELQSYTVFTAGTAAQTVSPDAARALIEYLASPAAVAVLEARGMERATR